MVLAGAPVLPEASAVGAPYGRPSVSLGNCPPFTEADDPGASEQRKKRAK
jgi:hypothetical protein